MRRTRLLAAALSLAAAASLACSTKHTTFTGELKLKDTAEANYQAGMDELKSENWETSQKFFEYVKTKYPYSPFAALADLRVADLKFDQKRYLEAADAYDQFAKAHPSSDQLEYAEFRKGLSQLNDAPEEFALFPPSYEKDQRTTEKAVDTLTAFLKDYPQSKFVPDARKALEKGRTTLADREWYVGEFYFKRKQWAGAAGRYGRVVEKFPGSRHETDAWLKWAQALAKDGQKYEARTKLQDFLEKHPNDKRAHEATALLESLR
jgi:outer membrane protein assembly factor BamD